MKNWRRMLAVGASAALMVSMMAGCSSTASTDEDSVNSSLDKDQQEAIGDDICETLLGVSSDTVLATVNDEELTALDLGYWLSYDINNFTYYYGTDLDWTTTISDDDDTTFADYVKSDALDIAVTYALLAQKAEDAELSLSEDETAEIDETMSGYVTDFGENLWDEGVSDGSIVEDDYTDEEKEAWIQENGEAEFARNLAVYCSTAEQLRKLNEVSTLYTKLEEYYYGDEGVNLPTDEELQDYVDENGYLSSRSILYSTITDEDGNEVSFSDMTDEQKATLKEEAQAALDEILASDDPESAFTDKMVNDNDDTGLTEETDCYIYASGTMVTEYEDAISALSEGEIGTTLVESSDYGYFIVERLAVDVDGTTVEGTTIRESYGTGAFSDLMTEWNDEATIETTEAYDNLDIATITENLTTLNDVLFPSDEEESTEETESSETETSETETAEEAETSDTESAE